MRMGFSSITVAWMNADISSGSVTFSNGLVSNTFEMNLN